MWKIPAGSIRLIGEFTTRSGPNFDDYFFVFLLRGEDCDYAASFYAEGRDEALSELRERFSGMADCGLVNSADYVSRVLWPPDVAGEPFLKFAPMKRGAGLLNRLLDACVPLSVVESSLRAEFRIGTKR